MRIQQKKLNKKKLFTWLIIILFVLAGAVALFFYIKHQSKPISSMHQSTTASKQAALKAAENTTPNQTSSKADDAQSNGGSAASSNTDNKAQVAVTIVNAAQYQSNVQVRAYAADVSANSVCTFTFSKDGYANITKQTNGNISGSTTSCSTLTIPVASFPAKGTWSLVVSYSSDGGQGSSNSQSLEVN